MRLDWSGCPGHPRNIECRLRRFHSSIRGFEATCRDHRRYYRCAHLPDPPQADFRWDRIHNAPQPFHCSPPKPAARLIVGVSNQVRTGSLYLPYLGKPSERIAVVFKGQQVCAAITAAFCASSANRVHARRTLTSPVVVLVSIPVLASR